MTLYPIPNVPDSLAREIYAALLRSLPPPHDGTQEARDARDARAMAAVAALIPENAAEAELAVDVVATDFHAKHALAAASHPNLPIEALKNCRAMVASMLRQSQATIRTLRQLQVDRRKLEDASVPAAMQRSGYRFHDSSEPAPPPDLELPPEPIPEPPHTQIEPDIASAEQYILHHPGRAAVICAYGGVPSDCGFPSPDPETVAAILALPPEDESATNSPRQNPTTGDNVTPIQLARHP
jgi:hypothetical protein